MFSPDLVVLREGRPVAVVEAKGRPVQPPFQESVVRQLQAFSTSVNSPWLLLVDPEKTQIFRSIDITRPVVTLSTGEIVRQETPVRPSVIGERTVLFAVDRWLHDPALVAQHAELREFAKDLSNHVTIVRDWQPGQSGGG